MLIKDMEIHEPEIFVYEDDVLSDALKKAATFSIQSIPVINRERRLTGKLDVYGLEYRTAEGKRVGELMKPVDNISIVRELEDVRTLFGRIKEQFFVLDRDERFKHSFSMENALNSYLSELERSASDLEGVLRCIDCGILAVNRLGNIVFINERAEKILDVRREDVLGQHITAVIPNSEIANILQFEEVSFGKSIRHKNRTLLVNRVPVRYRDDKVGLICSFGDYTDYSEIKQELTSEKTEKEILKTIFEIAYDGLLLADANGYILMMSNAYKHFLGVEDKDVLGKHVTEVVENTRLHIVAKTGVAEIADLQKIKGDYIVASRLPVFNNGKVTSVIGKIMFRNKEQLDDFYNKINKMEQQLENYKDELTRINKAKYEFTDILGQSNEMKQVIALARKAAYTDSNVLILGESGTGKELFAHSIHNSSARRNKPFIKINCAAIPNELLESELFGYEQGAFTGAKRGGKIGKFEVADQGTVFLDEVGDMPLHMQAKLLRTIQEREIERIGSNKPKKIDVRIIAATNRNIVQMIEEKKFRMDLYYRLNVVTLNIPPLRGHPEDIEGICRNFIEQFRLRYLKKVDGISDKAITKLRKYSWPGNVRELENIIERAINIMDDETVIRLRHLPAYITGKSNVEDIRPIKEVVEEAERGAIINCLEAAGNNKSKAAEMLGISRTALYEKMAKYALDT